MNNNTNPIIEQEIKILWAGVEVYSVDEILSSFERLENAATEKDLPRLIEILKSEKNNFWTRELLSDPICRLGGIKYLEDLFDALVLNELEGHDNDGFLSSLVGIAISDSQGCRQKLNELIKNPEFKHKESAKWLLTFCK